MIERDVLRAPSVDFMTSLLASGFSYAIDFGELDFKENTDHIGKGGYGDVFRGKWLGVIVAIKRFNQKYVASKKAVREFITEIEVIHGLRHPNIVLYMGVSFDHTNRYYMVTEFVGKGSLFEIVIKRGIKLTMK